MYVKQINDNLILSKIVIDVKNITQDLRQYSESGDNEIKQKIIIELKDFKDDTLYLRKLFSGDNYSRKIIDYSYMLESYIELANEFVESDSLSDGGQFSKFQSIKDLSDLIILYFKYAYTAMSEKTAETSRVSYEMQQKAELFKIVLISLVMGGIVIYILWVRQKVIYPIKNLTYSLSNFLGNREEDVHRIPVNSNDEIGMMSFAFNEMMDRINNLIFEIKLQAEMKSDLDKEKSKNIIMAKELKEMELQILQSRINPHFLFNSLNMIIQTAYLEEAEQTVRVLECMSDLLRYNLDNFYKVVKISDEINNIRDYFLIQKSRFQERFNFEINVHPDVAEVRVPCLTLQPLVENSLTHGLKMDTCNGKIEVRIEREGSNAVIKVRDNGAGMDMQSLNSLSKQIEAKKNGDNRSIGLNNVRARLKIMYVNSTLNLKSKMGKGTEVEIIIPDVLHGGLNV